MPAVIRLLRPQQWIKNAFVLAPLIFSGRFSDVPSTLSALAAVALFTVAASAVYVVNDLRDREADARHPDKRHRPLASGAVSPQVALAVLVALIAAGAIGAWFMPKVAAFAAGYIVLNVAYSIGLKQVPVLDLFAVSAGFVLRVYGGAAAIAVAVSNWMLVATLSLSLFLVVMKRRAELEHQGPEARSVLGSYTLPLLDRYAVVAATSTVVFYGFFVATVRPELTPTLPLVLLGVFRYWFIVEHTAAGESPTEALVRDWPLLATVLAYGLLSMWLVLQAGSVA